MTEFQFRALAKEPYREVCERLEQIAAGDSAALAELLGRARAALGDPALQRHNARSSQLRFWVEWLAAAARTPPPRSSVELAEIAVATLCMPGFQVNELAGEERSAQLVQLGESDGGLFGLLTERVSWFEPWLSEGLTKRVERYGYGRNMFRFTDDEVALLARSLPLAAHCDGARQPEYCRATRTRLSTLLDTVRARTDWAIVVSESG